MSEEIITGTRNAESVTPYERLKLAIIGPPKGGKTTLADTAPTPILHYDFDDRPESMAGHKGVVIKTLQDKNPIAPAAFNDFMADIGKFEYAKLQNKDLGFATIIVDSVTYLSQAALAWAMSNGVGGTKDMNVGGFKIKIARGYEPYDAETNAIANSFIRLFNLGVNIIACFHERPEEAPDSTNENPKFTGRVTVTPPRMNKILPLFNEVWRISPESGSYTVQTKPDYKFMGATCLMIDGQEKPNIADMITKHQKNFTATKRN